MPDGTPQVTPVWFDYTNGKIRVKSAKGHVKVRNMHKGAPVALSIIDPGDPDLLVALGDERLRAVVICPSNPFISIEPIFGVPGMRQAVSACAAPVVAVSPIIGGRAVKGPTAKMMTELGMIPSAAAVAKRYGDLLDGYVMDASDAEEAADVAPRVTLAPTLVTNLAEREQLARVVLEAADALGSSKRRQDLVA
jgi:LPPG:FO 2-phospho-L-lactate transferase